jgi:CheY-like chemotaxis protein
VEERRYCPSCGTDVQLERTVEGTYVFISCQLCGLGLGVRPATAAEVREINGAGEPALAKVGLVKQKPLAGVAEERVSAVDARTDRGPLAPLPAAAPLVPPPPRPTGPTSQPPGRQMRRVYVVEDSAFLRQLTRDLLVERQLAREVIDLPDGHAFVEAFARAVQTGEKPDLVVLDVRMPGMDGREAAYAVRAIETVWQQKRTPIMFFSAVLCDEPFKAVLQDLGSARYVRKQDEDIQRLGERVAEVLAKLIGAA